MHSSHLVVVLGVILVVISLPFLAYARQFNPDVNPPRPLPSVERSASATFSLPNFYGKYVGQYGKITYSIDSVAIIPNIPLTVVVKVEMPDLIASQWNVQSITVRLDDAIVGGWPVINGTKQAEMYIASWEKATPSVLTNEAWTSSQTVNFTSEGYVGGQVEILWTPAFPNFDWFHLWNLTDFKVHTITSLAIVSSLEANAPLQTAISSAWDRSNTNFNYFLAFLGLGWGFLFSLQVY